MLRQPGYDGYHDARVGGLGGTGMVSIHIPESAITSRLAIYLIDHEYTNGSWTHGFFLGV